MATKKSGCKSNLETTPTPDGSKKIELHPFVCGANQI
jgi:hypothetical protein